MAEVSFLIAFLAGIVSFLSPCILPLIPGYLAYLAGTSIDKASESRRKIFLNSSSFVLGFVLVFSILGVALNTILEAVAYDVQVWLARIGGLIIILFGLYLAGALKIPALQKEYKLFHPKGQGYGSSFLFGLAFAAGWTPCVGAVLGGILGLAAAQPGSAFALLLSYSLGLGLPFLLVGLFTAQASDFIRKNSSRLVLANKLFGVLLILVGVLVFTQLINRIAAFDLLFKLVPEMGI